MKRFNWKRILSLVLVLALVVGTLTWNKRAASAEGVTVSSDHSTVSVTTDEGVTITKKLLGIEMAENEPGFAYANIQLTVDGADATIGVPTIAKTDVVFVMDLSSSMSYNTSGKTESDTKKQRITAAKEAATAFAKGILKAGITKEEDADVRIGIASFGKKGHQNLQLSYKLDEVTNAIKKLSVGAGEGSSGGTGTNLQAGIKAAKDILSKSNAVNKIIVVLSDGQPTYSHKATAGNTEAALLTDGTSIKLLKSFDYSDNNIKGSGSAFTFKAYDVTNADKKQTGWYYAENKNSHKVNDFATNDNSKVTFEGTLKEGLVGTYDSGYNKYSAYFHIGATDNNGIPAISEAKSSGAIIYSIAYDIEANLTNSDSGERSDANYAKFVMTNLASAPSRYFAATSGKTTDTETAIKDVIAAITTSVDQLVAAAKGTGVNDMFPSYMKAVAITAGDNATIDNDSASGQDGYGNEVEWILGEDLRAGEAASITIKAKIDLDAMAAAYAAGHSEYANAVAVKEALANPNNNLWFDMNKEVVLSYAKVDGTPVSNNDIKHVEGSVNVPQDKFRTYNYTINYVDEKGEKVADPVKGFAFLGEKIDFTHCAEYIADNNNDVKIYDHSKTQITGATLDQNDKFVIPEKDVTITVTYYYKDYTVRFFDGVKTTPISKETYRYGAVITVPADPTKQQDNQNTYTFKGWDPAVAKNSDGTPVCYGDADYTAEYTPVTRYYTVKFVDLNGQNIIDPQRLAWGDNVTKPANSQVPKKESSVDKDYTFSGNWERLGGGEYNSTCDGDATYKPIYSDSVRKYTVTFYSTEEDAANKVKFDQKQYGYGSEVKDPVTEENVPTKQDDVYNTYEFDHWTPAFTEVKSDQEYFAVYTATPKTYTVNFIVEGVDHSKGYGYGDTIDNEPKNPQKSDNATNYYTFTGWKLQGNSDTQIETEIDKTATRTVTYVAVFEEHFYEYTIQFVNWNGQELDKLDGLYYKDDVSVSYTKGTPVKYVSEVDSKTYTHTFTGFNNNWDNNDNTMSITSITFDKDHKAVFRATFNDEYINYDITFVAEDGKTPILVSKTEGAEKLAVNQYHYGDTVTLPADEDIPTKANDVDGQGTIIHTYRFGGWTPEVVTVVDDATYKATYTESTSSYRIIFKDWNGTEIYNEVLAYGSPVTAPTNYTIKPEDATYTYSFGGWGKTVSPTVVGDATYQAVMTPTLKEYTVIFVDENGTTELAKYEGLYYLDTVNVTYDEEQPTKGPDEIYTYSFTGFDNNWDNEDNSKVITSITFDENRVAKFKATYEPVYIDYTVTFVLNNGADDITGQYHYNDDVTIPQDPEKEPDYDAEHKVNIREYTFAYWYKMVDGEAVEVTPSAKATEDVTYYAKYDSTTCTYDVTFTVNYPQGFEVPKDYFTTDTTNYAYGESVEVPTLVGEITVNGIVYELVASWTPAVDTTCHGNASYVRSYRIKPDTEYTVVFKFENKKDADFEAKYVYGAEIVVPENPTKDADETYTYKFKAWDPSVVTEIRDGKEVAVCKGNAVYSALYTPTYIDYEVRFVDENGQTPILVNGKEANTYHYNDKVAQPENPEKKKDNYNTYAFAGWVNTAVSGAAATMSVPACTGDITYKAEYKPTAIMYNVVFEDEGKTVTNKEYGFDQPIAVPENRTKASDDKFDYTFIGWAVKAENEAVSYSAVDVVIDPLTGENDPVYKVSQSITYTAVYKPSLRVFNVRFVDADGSDLGNGYSYKVTWGETTKQDDVAAATSAANGRANMMAYDNHEYFFSGWTNADKENVAPTDVVITTDTTFYASFREKLDFNINYHGKDASR